MLILTNDKRLTDQYLYNHVDTTNIKIWKISIMLKLIPNDLPKCI